MPAPILPPPPRPPPRPPRPSRSPRRPRRDYTFTGGSPTRTASRQSAGAATGSFTFHVHVAYLVTSVARVPLLVHRSDIAPDRPVPNLSGAGSGPHTYTLFWRAIDPATSKSVARAHRPRHVGGRRQRDVLLRFDAPRFAARTRSRSSCAKGEDRELRRRRSPWRRRPRSYPDDRDSAAQPAPRTTPVLRPSGATPVLAATRPAPHARADSVTAPAAEDVLPLEREPRDEEDQGVAHEQEDRCPRNDSLFRTTRPRHLRIPIPTTDHHQSADRARRARRSRASR